MVIGVPTLILLFIALITKRLHQHHVVVGVNICLRVMQIDVRLALVLDFVLVSKMESGVRIRAL